MTNFNAMPRVNNGSNSTRQMWGANPDAMAESVLHPFKVTYATMSDCTDTITVYAEDEYQARMIVSHQDDCDVVNTVRAL
jgi:hypothetical protein